MKKEGEADVSEFLAKRITMRFIRKFQIKEEDWDLYYLGIEVIVTTALTSLMIMALGIALRNFFGSVVFLLCFMSIRGYCGGYHAKTRVRCFFVSILCYLLSFGMMKGLLFLPEIAQNILVVWYLVCSVVVFAGTYEISTQIWATIDIIALLLCVKRRKRK